jgi:hypothetical protein
MGAQSTLRRQSRLREGGKLHDEYQVTTTPRHRDIMMTDRAALITLFHVLLPGLATLQAALLCLRGLPLLCKSGCFWYALLQYSTLLHALHLVRPPLGEPGHAQRRLQVESAYVDPVYPARNKKK